MASPGRSGSGRRLVVPHLLGQHQAVVGGIGDRFAAAGARRPAGEQLVLAALAGQQRPGAAAASGAAGAKRSQVAAVALLAVAVEREAVPELAVVASGSSAACRPPRSSSSITGSSAVLGAGLPARELRYAQPSGQIGAKCRGHSPCRPATAWPLGSPLLVVPSSSEAPGDHRDRAHPRRGRPIPEVAEAIAVLEGVSEVYSVTGDVDLIALVRVRDHEDSPT